MAEGKLGQNRGMRAVRLTDAAQGTGEGFDAPGGFGLPGSDGMGMAMGLDPGLGSLGGPDLGSPDLGDGFPAMDMGGMLFQATGTG